MIKKERPPDITLSAIELKLTDKIVFRGSVDHQILVSYYYFADLFVLPSIATAMDKTYPLARPLLFYTKDEPQGTEKAFIDFVLSAEGQEIVKVMDFVPLGKSA